jgi:hypothetical protein
VRNLLAAGAGLRFVDQPGIQVGVDRHLLAGHGVEGKTRRHFRGAHRAVRHHQILNRDQGYEQHEAYDIISADDELAKGFDDVPSRTRAFVAMQKNAAAGGQVQ